MRIAGILANKALSYARSGFVPAELLNVFEWDRTIVTASGRTVPYVNPAFRGEPLWDTIEDPFPFLNESLVNRWYANGQMGPTQVIRLRFAIGDQESFVDPQECTLSAGYYKGACRGLTRASRGHRGARALGGASLASSLPLPDAHRVLSLAWVCPAPSSLPQSPPPARLFTPPQAAATSWTSCPSRAPFTCTTTPTPASPARARGTRIRRRACTTESPR